MIWIVTSPRALLYWSDVMVSSFSSVVLASEQLCIDRAINVRSQCHIHVRSQKDHQLSSGAAYIPAALWRYMR